MKNFRKTIICIFALASCSLTGAALLLVQNTTASADESAPATSLLLPTSYEQYLTLDAPTDVALNDDYTAIADGNVIYVYDKADGVYRKYIHEVNVDPLKNNVTKLQFDEAGNLYFLDATYLYVLNPTTLDDETPTVTNTSFPCTTFYLHGNMLYFTDIKPSHTQLSKLDVLTHGIDVNKAETVINSLKGKPTITVYQEELYYSEDNTLTKFNFETNATTPVAWLHQSQTLTSIQIVDDVLCCTDNAQNFYTYNLLELTAATYVTPTSKTAGEYSALAIYNEMVYTVNGNSVQEFDVATQAFTNYEISNQSSSIHRLNEATDTCLAGKLLLIADNGNGRISVMNTATGEFQAPIANSLTTDYLISDGNTLLVADQDQAVLYSLQTENYGAEIAKFDNFPSMIIGAASVYGKYYLTLNNNFHYLITVDENGEWQRTEVERPATRIPALLTADAYGNLYVASGTKIHRYTEAQFLSKEEGEEVYGELPQTAKKIAVDYEGNLYALVEGKLYKLGEEEAYPLNQPLVYTPSTQTTATAFALSIEENTTYVLYAENYMATTTLFNLPTVKTIAVNGADESIFAKESAVFSVVQTLPDAFTVYFDINALEGATQFPYLSYERRAEPFTALKIGETETHNALAIFNEQTHEYQTCLVLKTQCSELPVNEYREDCPAGTYGYLTNAVSLYKFPYLNANLTASRLEADTKIVLLGKIDKLDHPYYYVSYVDENGETQTGFIPQAYVTDFSGTPTQPNKTVYGGLSNNDDAMYRLAFLILGVGVICILFDVMLLAKRKNDEDEND